MILTKPFKPVISPANASVSLQLMPWTDWNTVNQIVDEALELIKSEPNIDYQVGAFETVLEGNLSHLLKFIGNLIEQLGNKHGVEVFNVVKIMYKPNGQGCGIIHETS